MSRYSDRLNYLINSGLDASDYHIWSKKHSNLRYKNHKTHTCDLTFEQYVDLVVDAGITKPNHIGISGDVYQMGRINDIGNYTVGNCRFIHRLDNLAEKIGKGGYLMKVPYKVISPDRVIHEFVDLKSFCALHDINRNHMSSVCSGKLKQHKGWVSV